MTRVQLVTPHPTSRRHRRSTVRKARTGPASRQAPGWAGPGGLSRQAGRQAGLSRQLGGPAHVPGGRLGPAEKNGWPPAAGRGAPPLPLARHRPEGR